MEEGRGTLSSQDSTQSPVMPPPRKPPPVPAAAHPGDGEGGSGGASGSGASGSGAARKKNLKSHFFKMLVFKQMLPAKKTESFKLMMLAFLCTFSSFKTTLGLDEISSGKTGTGNQTFRSGQPLYEDQRLVSKGGQFEMGFFSPDSCNNFAVCGPNGFCNITSTPACNCYDGFQPHSQEEWQSANWSAGCIRKKPLQCSSNVFNPVSGISMPANSQIMDLESAQVCQLACLGNCSCTAYAYNGGRCSLWTGDLLDTRALVDFQGDLYVRSADVILAKKKEKSSVLVALSITIPLLVCISLTYLLWRICRRKHTKKEAGETSENLLFLNLGFSSKQNTDRNNIITGSKPGEKKVFNLPQFSFSSISAATDNFSPANKLGEGGFGPVYKRSLVEKRAQVSVTQIASAYLDMHGSCGSARGCWSS
ncbi:hypothetical protein ACET3Z_008188 [Daucus carota]